MRLHGILSMTSADGHGTVLEIRTNYVPERSGPTPPQDVGYVFWRQTDHKKQPRRIEHRVKACFAAARVSCRPSEHYRQIALPDNGYARSLHFGPDLEFDPGTLTSGALTNLYIGLIDLFPADKTAVDIYAFDYDRPPGPRHDHLGLVRQQLVCFWNNPRSRTSGLRIAMQPPSAYDDVLLTLGIDSRTLKEYRGLQLESSGRLLSSVSMGELMTRVSRPATR